jgi:alkanesulfonate monooxygenase SsuD/methylene tetrahydromethanopterin reductase-like flavin-dependent oxidoreductase (luciferase family)
MLGAAGGKRTFDWIAASADGWLTTPGEDDIVPKITELASTWREAGRDGNPQVAVLAGKPDPEQLAAWINAGVTDVLFGMPDRSADEVAAYLIRLAAKLGIEPNTPAPGTEPDAGASNQTA